MLVNLATLAACLSLAAAVPFAANKRQTNGEANKYGDNGTLTDPPPNTTFSRHNPDYTTDQLNAIKLAYTTQERLALIKSFGNTNDYFKFDLSPAGSKSNAASGLGGVAFLAEVANYPVLMGTGISIAIGYLNPCGLDSIHLHNRADEMVLLVKGTSLKTGFVLEDGFDLPVETEIGLYQATIRPKGSLHWEFNDNCDSAVFVAALANEDPGVSRTSQNFFINPPEIVDANLGYPDFLNGVNITNFRFSLPAAFQQGAKECFDRCGIKYDTNQAGGISRRV